MRIPIVLRSQHDEIVRVLGQVSALKDRRIAELEALNKTLLNQVWKGQFGELLFPEAAGAQPAPEPTMGQAEKLEAEAEAAKSQDIARLASLRRTSPSKLAPAIAQSMQRDMAQRAQTAHGTTAVHGTNHGTTAVHPARAAFAAAERQAEVKA